MQPRATDGPTAGILDRNPVPKSASLFTMNMWKMIIGQTVYKLAVIFMLYFAGDQLLDPQLDNKDPELRSKQLSTVVFNTFVWMQVFNVFNCRRLDNKFNVFEGMFQNYWFLGINTVIIGGQIMIVYIGGQAFRVTRLNGVLWAVCLICAVGCMPWAMILRMIPDHHFAVVFNSIVGIFPVILRPFVKFFRIFGKGLKACFQPIIRFTLRPFSRHVSKHIDHSSTQESTNLREKDKRKHYPMKHKQPDTSGQHQDPAQITVPSTAITT